MSNITVSVRVKQPNSPVVEAFGSSSDVISDQEIHTFDLTDGNLKDAVEKHSGGRPDDVFLKSPTPWNDLYSTCKWSQVRRTLQPRSVNIINVREEPVIILTQEFINNSSTTAKYNAGITQQVEQTVSSTWSRGGELTIGQEITYGIDVQGTGIGGSTSFTYTSSWGRESTRSKAITVGSSSGVEVELAPGQAVIATLHATRGFIEVQMDYTATLAGDVACNYPNQFKEHYFWRYDLGAVQDAGNLRKTVDSTEILKIDYYSEAKVLLEDKRC